MFDFFNALKYRTRAVMPTAETALPGRSTPMAVENRHFVLERPLLPPYPRGCNTIVFGMGCFWGAEKRFWSLPDVHVTAVGYSAGFTPNPTYEEVCNGQTGHNEVVLVVYQDKPGVLDALLRVFWESHDPTQGMRQGNDVGTQYRSGIYYHDDAQRHAAETSLQHFAQCLQAAGLAHITTEICTAKPFYFAESYHQQYLAKNPGGYCGLGGTGVCY